MGIVRGAFKTGGRGRGRGHVVGGWKKFRTKFKQKLLKSQIWICAAMTDKV